MAKVLLDMSISLDGFIAGVDDADGGLHNWYFAPVDESTARNKELIQELIDSSGAIVMGRRAYQSGVEFDGFVDNPYKVPHFVLTHYKPQSLPKGDTEFTFVTDGVESLIQQAKAAAGAKTVVIGGGASLARQCLQAGLLDEIQLHFVPVLLGDGLRLFEASTPVNMEILRVIDTPNVTHVQYRILKK